MSILFLLMLHLLWHYSFLSFYAAKATLQWEVSMIGWQPGSPAFRLRLPRRTEYHADRGSLSSGSWNKCVPFPSLCCIYSECCCVYFDSVAFNLNIFLKIRNLVFFSHVAFTLTMLHLLWLHKLRFSDT